MGTAPARRVVPNPLPAHAYGKPTSLAVRRVKELVFFGRLEARKGLHIFISALNEIDPSLLNQIKVTFLGKGDEATIRAINAAKVSGVLNWSVLSDKDAAGATDYVSAPGRLAVLPSLYENSSMAVAECIGRGASFLASDVGGTADLLHPEDRASHLVQPNTAALASALSDALRNGLPSAVRPAVSADAIQEMWQSIAAACVETRNIKPPRCDWPLVSIVLVTRNRPTTLVQALDGIRAQTWPNIEVILVDDGSTSREALSVLDGLEVEFARRGWTIVRQQNRYLGAARNLGWRKSSGEYVIFHDDDNVSLPHLVKTYVRAAQNRRQI
ncbi:glycosyltransferase [Siccirubricoccus deserti]